MQERLNVRAFMWLVAVVAALAVGVFFVHRFQVRSHASALRELAGSAKSQGRPDRAARLLNLYLTFSPADLEARAEYGSLLETLSDSPRARQAAIETYEEVLLRDRNNQDVRKRLVRLQIPAGFFSKALPHLRTLRKEFPKDAELAYQAGLCHELDRAKALAAEDYRQAIKLSPQALRPYLHLADLLRLNLGDPDGADKIMDEMVAANMNAYGAYLARARYRLALNKTGSEEDVVRAYELAPDDANVLLLAAQIAQDSGRIPEARAHLQKALKKHPGVAPVYHALALLEARDDAIPKAVEYLRQGLNHLSGNSELLSTLAGLLLDQRDLAEAGKVIAEMRRWKIAPERVALLEARAEMADGKWKEARTLLEANRPLLAAGSGDLLVQADLLLGRCYGQMGHTDLEMSAYRRAADRRHLGARAALARAFTRLGNLEEALGEYRRVVADPAAAPDAWLDYAQLLVLREVALPARTPDIRKSQGEEVEQALKMAEKKMAGKNTPGSARVALLRAESLAARGSIAEAEWILKDAAGLHPKQLEIPVARALLAGRRGQPAEAQAILHAAEKQAGASVELDLARLQLAPSVEKARSSGALRALEEHLNDFRPQDRLRGLDGLAEAHLRWGDPAGARQRLLEAAALRPQDLPVRFRLFDLAAQAGDLAVMERVVGEIRAIEGEGGGLGHYGEAVLLLTRAKHGNREGLEKARQHLTAAALLRPAWAAIPTCRAMIADEEGKAGQALTDYLRAVELGERRVAVLRRAVQLLYAGRRYGEADQLIRRLQPAGPLSPELQKLAAEISLRNADPQRALELAGGAVAADSRDCDDQIWLAQVLLAAGKQDEAHAALRRAVALANGKRAPWVALVHFHLRFGRTKEVEAVIHEAAQRMTGPEAHLALGYCYEAIGHKDRAEAEYRKASQAAPDDANALRQLVSFYQRAGAPAKAVAPLRSLLASRVAQKDVRWARRALAVCLAAADGYPQFREALDLVEKNLAVEPGSRPDLQAKARILGSRPSHREEALRMLQRLGEQRSLAPEDAFLLARLHADADNWPEARRLMLGALARQSDRPEWIRFFATRLLERGETTEAELWLGKLERLTTNDPGTLALRAAILVAQGNTHEALAGVKTYVEAAGPKDRAARLRAAADLLEQLSQRSPKAAGVLGPAAEAIYREAAQSGKSGDALSLAVYLARTGRADEAVPLCTQAVKDGTAETVALAVTQIAYTSSVSEDQLGQLEVCLKDCLAAKPDSLQLHGIAAAFQTRRGRYAEAEVSYRRILEKAPSASLLNNLAYVLTLQEGKADEALELLQKAVTLAGTTAELLDTRGTLYMRTGRTDEALRDLGAAVAQEPTAVRRLHLAQAFQRTGRRADAGRALARVAAADLDRSLVLPAERADYQQLRRELGQ
jgi:tetratricopeptide (TPR) repeat protein